MDISGRIASLGIIPVIKLKDAEKAAPLCGALARGGLPLAEITFRTDAAEESIRRVAAELPDVLVGAGTVLSIDQADRAVGAGARFVVTPGFNPDVVAHCVRIGIPVFPGCPTTSDVERALGMGLRAVKFFPAEAMGGVDTLKAFGGPYGDVKFIPTGGVTEANLAAYLALPNVLACGGSWLAPEKLVDAGDFAAIEEIARSSALKMLGFELRHVGVNCRSEGEAAGVAGRFGELFGWAASAGNSSVFAGTQIEAMKSPFLGDSGHIAVGCRSVARARAYLEARGVAFAEETAKYKGGELSAIYLRESVGGFAVHLVG